MFLRTTLIVIAAAALNTAAEAASSCGAAGCRPPAIAVATPDASFAGKTAQKGSDAAAAFVAQALAERQSKLGEEHPFTVATANALAAMYRRLGRYTEAEALYIRSLETCQRTLGDKHPLTLGTVKGLVLLYAATGRHSEAAVLTKRAEAADPRQFDY